MSPALNKRNQLCRLWWLCGVNALLLLLTSCKPGEHTIDKRLAEYQARLQACIASMEGQSRIPIMGGGELDTSRFAFHVPHMDVTDGEKCGAVGFEAEFYWTGEKIVPNAPRFTGLQPGQKVPPNWQFLHVGAVFGNRRLGKACQAHFAPLKCPDPNRKTAEPPPTWPEHLTVRPKAFPNLDMRLSEKRSSHADFFIVGWPRRDGVTPRVISCWGLTPSFPAVENMTIRELEQLDFGQHDFPCSVEYGSFDFKGGLARIGTGTRALREIVPALQSLQQYLSDSVAKED